MPAVEAQPRRELRDYAVELRQLAYTVPNGVGEHDLLRLSVGCALLPIKWSPRELSQPPMIHPVAGPPRADPVRLCVARTLGHDIDGAWWPRADRIANELPHLVAVLMPLLGHITSINVNWPPLQRPPDLNWLGWRYKPQHLMTVSGDDGSANLLIVPYATHSALALMVLRQAANLPINPADCEKPVFLTACSILLAAQQQCVATKIDNPSRNMLA